MLTQLDQIQTEGLAELSAITDEEKLEQFRVAYLGKKGKLTAIAGGMKNVPTEEKPAVGAKLNEVRTALTAGIEEKQANLEAEKDAEAVKGIDLTLPGRPTP